MTSVAVIGASGFVGRHVLSELERLGVAPLTATSRSGDIPYAQRNTKCLALDLSHPPEQLMEALGNPEVVIHLAWDGLTDYSSFHHFTEELVRQYQFLYRLVDQGLQHLVVTGTCFEYGSREGCLKEADDPRPVTPYGFAKNALRQQLEFLRTTKPFSLTWARLFYMFGEGQSKKALYSQLKKSVTEGKSAFPMSGGEQLRDFLSINEVARVIVRLSQRTEGADVINICSGKPVSVRSLVEGWLNEMGCHTMTLERGYYPYPNYEPFAFWGSTEKLQKILNENSASN